MPMLTVERVSRSFGAGRSALDWLMGRPEARLRAVRDVSLTLERGETLAVVGESGCGKSTLARLIAGLHRPETGRVVLEGDGAGIQMVFQDPYSSLNPRRTVDALLAEALAHHAPRNRGAARGGRVAELLAEVGLDPATAARYPHALSGGQRQRVSIARALAAVPRLLIADEPVSALDASVQAQILNLFQDLNARQGIALMFISHDMQVVRHISQRVAVMYMGEIVEMQPTAALFARPLHPYTRALIAAVPDPTRRTRRLREALTGEPPDPFALHDGCAFAARCPLAEPACARPQALREAPGGRLVRCHRAEP